MISPFIRPIIGEGTFYTFSSSAEDMTFSIANDGKKFSFSKYALLNIPPQMTPTDTENFCQLGSIQGAFDLITGVNRNKEWAESLQNYCLNFESGVITDSNYDSNLLGTTSERIFWKWLKEIGAVRWEDASTLSNVASRYKEEIESNNYLRVVQYLGTIDVTNNLKNNENSYSEIYIYVPSNQGNTPYVLFKTNDDGNYSPNRIWQHNPADPLNGNLIWNRKQGEVHPGGLNFQGHWDSELLVPGYTISTNGVPGSPFPSNAPNSFFSGSFTDTTNDTIEITDGTTTYTKLRNRLDGVEIDWDAASYANIKDNFRTWSESSESQDYNFNAVLIYYDLEDHLGNVSTNLYGVLFLDKWTAYSGNAAIIPTMKKFKPSDFNGQGGNSYGFKTNIKIDSNLSQVQSQTNVNEYNNMSMTMFMDALNDLKNSGLLLRNHIVQTETLRKEIESLTEEVQTYVSGTDVEARIASIENILEETKGAFESNEALLDMISKLREDVNGIYTGAAGYNITWDLGPFQQGRGITIDKSGGTIKFSNKLENPALQYFEDTDFTTFPTYSSIEKVLQEGTNLWRIKFNSDPDRNVKVYIDDSLTPWLLGQTIKFSTRNFDLDNGFGIFNIEFLTDKVNGWKSIYTLTNVELVKLDQIFELVCTDATNLIFDVDLINT